MPKPKIEEVDYYMFAERLQKATDNGLRLEKTDQPQWDEYVSAHGVNEVAMHSWGKSKFANPHPVVINDGGTWAGYYVYSKEDELVLKWTLVDD